jgi:MFS family permease
MAALGATLLMQTVASYLSQTLPVVAPLLTASAGLRTESIGVLNAVVAAGTVAVLLFGGPLLARYGPVRALQVGAGVSALGLLIATLGTLPALLLASLLLGMGYGPSAPAGSRILAATAPKGHRTLIFSVKQSGALLGGGSAGLLAPLTAAWGGWPAALLLGVLIAAVAAVLIQPLRAQLDEERDPGARIHVSVLFGRTNLGAPFRALGLDPLLWPLTLLGLAFAIVQGCLFTFSVSWLVEQHGLSLVAAGGAFSVMQGSGMVARILLAMLADRTGNATRNLVVQAFLAALALAGFALQPTGTGYGLILVLAGLCGFLGASWNGITLAEVARLVPPARVADATSGSTLVIFCGYTVGPAAFAAIVSATGDWRAALLLVAAQLVLTAAIVGTALLRLVRGGR